MFRLYISFSKDEQFLIDYDWVMNIDQNKSIQEKFFKNHCSEFQICIKFNLAAKLNN